MSASVHRIGAVQPQLLTKQQLAAHLNRSPRWIEIKVNQGMPSENLDRYGRRLFDLRAVEAWLADGKPQATSVVERLAKMEAELTALRGRVRQLESERRAS